MRRSWLDSAVPRVTALVLLFAAAGFHESIRQHSLNSITTAAQSMRQPAVAGLAIRLTGID